MDPVFATAAGLGALIGLLLALTGAGGSILAVPLLLFGLHLGVAQAAPVALLAVALSAGVGALIGLRAGIVRYRAAALMALAGMVLAPLGLWLAQRLPNAPLTLIFAAVLLFVAVRMFRQARAPATPDADKAPPPCRLDGGSGRFVWTAACGRALALSGATAGFLSGLLGVGGGFVIVPALRRASDAPMQAIVATSLAVITLVSAFGVVTTGLSGHLDWRIGLPFAAGAIAGMLGGRLFAARLSGARLQQGFALVAGLIAVAMALRVALAG